MGDYIECPVCKGDAKLEYFDGDPYWICQGCDEEYDDCICKTSTGERSDKE